MPMRVMLVVVATEAAIELATAAGVRTTWLGGDGLSDTGPRAGGRQCGLAGGAYDPRAAKRARSASEQPQRLCHER